jgi:hypothetical protein
MTPEPIALEDIRIASPCKADWAKMRGDARVRFCDSCSLNVYNISEMTRAAAEALIRNAEGRPCIRLYRRADGTVLTRDCPRGIRAVPWWLGRAGVWILSMLGLAAVAGCSLPETGGVCGSEGMQGIEFEMSPESR